ncbi:unnamed protein product [Gadus morhua 'NCC']
MHRLPGWDIAPKERIATARPGNIDYALVSVRSMADIESERLELALENLFVRHCNGKSAPKSKEYCGEFCKLVEEHTGRWQVPLPQLKVLRSALCSFTTAAAVFPAECQHIHYTLSSLAVSFFELMLFFSKEEFSEYPLKDIIDSFQACHSRLLQHNNTYMQQVKQVIKVGGPWESLVLQDILQEASVQQADVEEYFSSEVPLFLELRVRYLQACERLQEAMALAKSCMENSKASKHLYFHQAYLTCLYKASLHEHMHKEMAEIDGRDAVEIICNTESVEEDELLLSLCKAFLNQQLQNGDMYYIWDLVFLWSRLFLRAHPSGQGFLAECHHLVSTATNIRAIFPFIKVVHAELGSEGEQFCVEVCARGLQMCDLQAHPEIHSLLCKTIAFLLPYDLEVCQACALLVFCQERSLEAYKTVCLLYTQPEQEQHPHNNPVPTNIRFYILQVLKERLCFDPEFWNLLTLRTYCLELISDQAMKEAVLSEMEVDEEQYPAEPKPDGHTTDFWVHSSTPSLDFASISPGLPTLESGGLMDCQPEPSKNTLLVNRKKRRRKRICLRQQSWSDDEADVDDDPEFKSNIASNRADGPRKYSLRRKHTVLEKHKSDKPERQREYLSRCVKNQIFKRKGRKRRWLQGVPRLDQGQVLKDFTTVKINGRKRGRKPFPKLELSFPDNELWLQNERQDELETTMLERELLEPFLSNPHSEIGESIGPEKVTLYQSHTLKENERGTKDDCIHLIEPKTEAEPKPTEEACGVPATESDNTLGSALSESTSVLIQVFHNYCHQEEVSGDWDPQPLESTTVRSQNGDTKLEGSPVQTEEEDSNTPATSNLSWRDRLHRTELSSHLRHCCTLCVKDFKGLNVMRHAISHLRGKQLLCIFCSRRFKQFRIAKRHILEHIDEMRRVTTAPDPPDVKVVLTREGSVIRNLRSLLKRSLPGQKTHKSTTGHLWQGAPFKDEQVVIEEDLVIVKDPSFLEEKGEGMEKENPVDGKCGAGDFIYYLCPSERCNKVFLKMNAILLKHAIKYHLKEENVLEKTFLWSKSKCTICVRPMDFLQQYKEHMQLHDAPNCHFCYHQDCEGRFVTALKLKEHVKTHQPLRAQCYNPECKQVFPNLQGLYDHEWRHYVPAPLKQELEAPASTVNQIPQNSEAPWKQRVKIEEIWLSGKEQKENSKAQNLESLDSLPLRDGENAETVTKKPSDSRPAMLCTSGTSPKINECSEGLDHNITLLNGHASEVRVDKTQMEPTTSHIATLMALENPLFLEESLNVKACVTKLTQVLDTPQITEDKASKCDGCPRAHFHSAPQIRLPPSAYLTETELNMPKRREVPATVKSTKTLSWRARRVQEQEEQAAAAAQALADAAASNTRRRCSRCLSSYNTPKELEEHQALNKCSALFGFDTDDESD